MLKLLFIGLLPFLPLIVSAQKSKEITEKDIEVLCWNEDEINSYQFGMLKGKGFKFIYSICHKDGLKETTENYTGTWTASVKDKHTDTLFLSFKGAQPANLCHYLVMEASGNYVIQYFTDGTKRMFLRQQRIPCYCLRDGLL